MHLGPLLLCTLVVAASGCVPTAPARPECPARALPAATAAPPLLSLAPVPPASETVVTAGAFTVAVRATAFGNLAYQLDCLADLIHGSSAAIHSFWDPGWTKDDDAALATWKEVRTKYNASAELGGDEPPSLVPLPHRSVEVDKQLRIASLLAGTREEFRTNLRVLVAPQDADALIAASQHFAARFDPWWAGTGAAVASRFRTGLAALFERPEVAAIVTRAAAFYAAPLPKGTPIDFDLVVLPGPTEHTSGEQMLAHGVIELPGGDEKPEDRMDILCHELFHFFYNARTPAQQLSLAARFTSSSDPLSGLAYFLLDEAVATAFGNGVVNRLVNPPDFAKRRAKEQGFYANHAIDATAKGILSRTSEDPTLGPVLDSAESVATLIAATRGAVGDDPRPIEYLHSFAGESDPAWWDEAMKVTLRASSTNNLYTAPLGGGDGVAKVTTHPALSAVFIVPRGRLDALAAYGDAIPKESRGELAREAKRAGGSFAYVFKRGQKARAFVIVAVDAAGARSVADALFAEDKAVLGVFRPRS